MGEEPQGRANLHEEKFISRFSLLLVVPLQTFGSEDEDTRSTTIDYISARARRYGVPVLWAWDTQNTSILLGTSKAVFCNAGGPCGSGNQTG